LGSARARKCKRQVPRSRISGRSLNRREEVLTSSTTDMLIMLLSTDWFFPHWPLIGIRVDPGVARTIQAGCRDLVRQFTSGAEEYWHVDFSDDRVHQTRSQFLKLLTQSEAPETVLALVESIAGSSAPSESAESAHWLVLMITEQLIREQLAPSLQPDARVKTIIGVAWQQAGRRIDVATDLKEECLQSDSDWDVFTRSLTPDSPWTLSVRLTSIGWDQWFEQFWKAARRQTGADEFTSVRGWYERVARHLTGEEVSIAE
jgi:hypothetical protein